MKGACSSILFADKSNRDANLSAYTTYDTLQDARNLILSRILSNFSFGFLQVAESIYLYSAVGLIATGLVITTQSLAGAFLAIPIAMLSDNFGRKKFVVLGQLFNALAGLILFLTLNVPLIFLAGLFLGLASASTYSPFAALFAEKTTNEENRNRLFTLLSFSSGIANGFGALASGAPATIFARYFGLNVIDSFRPMFLVQFVLTLCAALLVLLKVGENSTPVGKSKKNRFLSPKSWIKIPKKSMFVVKRLSILGLIGLGAGVILPIFSLWFQLKFGIDVSVIGPLFSAMIFITSIASLITPRIARRRGSVFTIAATQLLSLALLILIPFMPDYLSAGVMMISRNVLMNMAGPIQQSFQMGLIAPDERATAASIINTFDAIPRAWGPSLGTYLFSLGLLDVPFFITAGLYSCAICSFYFIFRNIKPDETNNSTAVQH